MGYFNYHSTARQLLAEGKLTAWYYTSRHNHISPALVLVFDDVRHPRMPIREHRWHEYLLLLPPEKRRKEDRDPRGARSSCKRCKHSNQNVSPYRFATFRI